MLDKFENALFMLAESEATIETLPDALSMAVRRTALSGRGASTLVLVLEETGSDLSRLAAEYSAVCVALKEVKSQGDPERYKSGEAPVTTYRLADVMVDTAQQGIFGIPAELRRLARHLSDTLDELLTVATRLDLARPQDFEVGVVALVNDITRVQAINNRLIHINLPVATQHTQRLYLALAD